MLMHYIPEVEAVESIEPQETQAAMEDEEQQEDFNKLQAGLAKVKGSHRHRNRERAAAEQHDA